MLSGVNKGICWLYTILSYVISCCDEINKLIFFTLIFSVVFNPALNGLVILVTIKVKFFLIFHLSRSSD